MEVGCLEGGVESKLGDCHGWRRFVLASGRDEAAGRWDHVFAFETSAIDAAGEGAGPVPG